MIVPGKIRTFWRLVRNDKLLVGEALLLPAFVSMGLRWMGVARTQAYLRQWAAIGSNRLLTPDPPSEVLRSVRRAQRIAKRAAGAEGTCLVRSLGLWALMLRRGVETDLRVGVRKRNGEIEAHAWIEREGIPLNENADVVRTYTVFDPPVSFDAWHTLKQ